jgi:uncharacterized protein
MIPAIYRGVRFGMPIAIDCHWFHKDSVRLPAAGGAFIGALHMSESNPCLSCGACCALFKVVFDLGETDTFPGGGVPAGLTVKVDAFRCAMRGTEIFNKRCAALKGIVARGVSCAIYGQRPSCCRDFRAGWEKDVVNPICNRARTVYGLQPFDDY